MRGYCGIGIFHGKTDVNVGTLLRSAQSFGAHFVFTIGRRYARQASDTGRAVLHLPVYNFATLDDLVAHLPAECPLVGVELSARSRPLGTYLHPERACYLLGAEDHGLSPEAIAACHDMVEIEGGRYCLNVAVAGSVVLWDRIRKDVAVRQDEAGEKPRRVTRLSHATSDV